MKLGLLADIHEHTKQLRKAIDVLRQHGADRFVVLGDVFEMGKRIEETVYLLQQFEAVGVWGNHDVGLCFDPGEEVCQRYSAAVLDFMGCVGRSLGPRGTVPYRRQPTPRVGVEQEGRNQPSLYRGYGRGLPSSS